MSMKIKSQTVGKVGKKAKSRTKAGKTQKVG